MPDDDGRAPHPPPPRRAHALSPGQLVADRYRVVRALGHGAFGHTYQAVDTAAGDRPVAIKQLRTDSDRAWKAYDLFEREAAALRSLRHHGIPEIFDHLRGDGDGAVVAYLVMEYIDGPSLEQRLADGGSLDPAALLRLALGLLDILEYLHARVPPVLHRDIKPANILLRPDGSPALVDFGAVRTVFRAADEAGSTVVGTFGYMPFEQTMGQASPASDLYALGATLLHVVTGRPPSEFASRDGIVEVPAALPGGPALRGVLARLLAQSASARYQTARETREALLAPVLGAAAIATTTAPTTPTTTPTTTAVARVHAPSVALAPAPRAISGDLKVRFRRVVHTPMRMVFASQRPSDPLSPTQRVLGVLFGLVTIGIVPMIYWLWWISRRSRTRPFFEHGVPATGRVLQVQKDSFEWFEVTYVFELDGATHRGVDTMIPSVARLWHAGDEVELLVLPDRGHDSIIISTT